MKYLATLAAGALMGAMSSAHASTVDLFDLAGNFNQSNFPGTAQYAQTVTADDSFWSDLAIRVVSSFGGTFGLGIYGVRDAGLSGTGWAPDVNNLLFSTTLTHGGTGQEEFNVNPNVAVTSGTGYVFVLNRYLGNQTGTPGTLPSGQVRATEFEGSDKYLGGEFIFSNTASGFSNTTVWTSRFGSGEDLAFQATFGQISAVPVPAALPLLLSALGGIGFAARRRRSRAA